MIQCLSDKMIAQQDVKSWALNEQYWHKILGPCKCFAFAFVVILNEILPGKVNIGIHERASDLMLVLLKNIDILLLQCHDLSCLQKCPCILLLLTICVYGRLHLLEKR